LLAGRERGIENFNIHAFVAEMRADIQNPKRRIRLHDLKLFGIFVEEIPVGEE
jgi:hypothetical protein